MDAGAAPYSPKDKVFRDDEKNHKGQRKGKEFWPYLRDKDLGPEQDAPLLLLVPGNPFMVDIESGKAQSYQHPSGTLGSPSLAALPAFCIPTPLGDPPSSHSSSVSPTGSPLGWRQVGRLLVGTSSTKSFLRVPSLVASLIFQHLLCPNVPVVISPPLVWLHLAPASPVWSPPVMSKGEKGEGYLFLVPSPTGMAWEKEPLTLVAPSASFPGLGA